MERPLSKQRLETKGESEDHSVSPGKRPRALSPTQGYLLPLTVALTLLAVGWHLWTQVAHVPVYLVPGPLDVLERLVGDIGFFARHGAITFMHALAGFSLGSAVAISGATLMAHSRFLERSLFPLAVLVKVIPIVAVAPLFVIWFGFGSPPIVTTAALITFFPVLVNTLTGLKSVSPGALDFFRSVDASSREIFFKLRAPSSLPYLFAAFRIAIPLSVIGAVVGELFGGDLGLGSVIFVAHHNLDTPTTFSAILVLAVMGISLTILPSYIERRVLFWHDSFIAT